MKLVKIFLLTISFFWLLSGSTVLAQVNIIENYQGETIGNINSNFGSNAWVVATGEPENSTFIQVVNTYSFNWVIRGHAAWRSIGQDMISSPEQAAARWHNFFAQINKTIYFEPWNEPEHPTECGTSSVGECADRIIAYMDALTANLPDNVRLMTPAFDTLHPNHIALIEELTSRGFFSQYPFAAVSYHIYGTSNITSYRQFSWTENLPIIITESGALENGQVTYSPALLCQFYQQAVPVWQTDSRILSWNLLIINPERSSNFNLFAPEAQCVVDALVGNFHCQDCQAIDTAVSGGSFLSRALKCQPVELQDNYTCGTPNQTTDCFWAPNLQQACNEIRQPADAPYCSYNVYPDVVVTNNGQNCDETGCQVAGGENHTANMGESGDWNDNGIPNFLANLVFALIGRPETDLPWGQSNTNLLNAGYDQKSAPYAATQAEKDKVMIQAVLARGGLPSNGNDFIIGCAFPSGETVDAVALSPNSEGCAPDHRPVYASELACMNETRTYKILTEGLRIENVPFPDEVNQVCDDYYGADRFVRGAISPTSGYAQEHNISGQVMGILPHHAHNRLWRILPQNMANSLEFETRISPNGHQEQTTYGTAGYLGGLINAAGYDSDGVSQSEFAAANMLLSQEQLGQVQEENSNKTNFCANATSINYQSASDIRINSLLRFLISLAGRIFNFGSSTDDQGNIVYETQQEVQEPVPVQLTYPGWIESNQKIRKVYANFIPEAEMQRLRAEEDAAIILRNRNTNDEDKAQRLPAAEKTTEVADTFYKWSWPQSWQEGRF